MKSLYRSASFAALVVASSIAFAFAAPAVAAPIDYSIEGTGSGTLNGVSFMNDPVTIALAADTNNIMPFQGIPTIFINTGPVTVAVDGLTPDTLLNSGAAVNQDSALVGNAVAGFAQTDGNNLFFATNSAFASYALGPIGPTSGPALGTSTTFMTGTGGTFTLTPTGDATFEANVVPLPAALPLFATGLGALGLLGWRRKRKMRSG